MLWGTVIKACEKSTFQFSTEKRQNIGGAQNQTY